MKVGGKRILGDLPQYFKFVRWMLTSPLNMYVAQQTVDVLESGR